MCVREMGLSFLVYRLVERERDWGQEGLQAAHSAMPACLPACPGFSHPPRPQETETEEGQAPVLQLKAGAGLAGGLFGHKSPNWQPGQLARLCSSVCVSNFDLTQKGRQS